MTTSKLSRLGHSIKPQESDGQVIKSDVAEAHRLYQRGVAAARGGQKRVAAGLLTRSLQHNPNNEGAWLWLSGVIDDPHQQAFCLNSVLKLNPNNERAQKGLRWLEERQLLQGTPQPAPLMDIEVGDAATAPAQTPSRKHDDSWWFNWRQLQRDMSRVNMLIWSIPLILLFLALIIYNTFSLSLSQTPPPPVIPTPPSQSTVAMVAPMPTVLAAPALPPTATPEPILMNELAPMRRSKTIAYLNELGPLRADLQSAVERYRAATGKPGSSAVNHATAAQNLRTSVQQAYTTMQEMEPPPELEQAHQDYLKGLELELEAIDAMEDFYSSYKSKLANLAALRFQDANAHFARARTVFETHLQYIGTTSTVSVHTVR